jgi:hypothetical protein
MSEEKKTTQDTFEGTFFYVTVVPNDSNPYNLVPKQESKVMSSISQSINIFESIEKIISQIHPECEFKVIPNLPDDVFAGVDVMLNGVVGSSIRLKIIKTIGMTKH